MAGSAEECTGRCFLAGLDTARDAQTDGKQVVLVKFIAAAATIEESVEGLEALETLWSSPSVQQPERKEAGHCKACVTINHRSFRRARMPCFSQMEWSVVEAKRNCNDHLHCRCAGFDIRRLD